MLVIRFSRTGKKNKPYYRIVVTEKTNTPQSGRFLELVGSYDPYQKKVVFKEDRIKHWISCGAQPSDRVHNLLVDKKVIQGPKRAKKLSKKKKQVEDKEVQSKEEEKPIKESSKQEDKEVEKQKDN